MGLCWAGLGRSGLKVLWIGRDGSRCVWDGSELDCDVLRVDSGRFGRWNRVGLDQIRIG